MTKCLLKALKAVDLQTHVESFCSLGYDSAGALAHFHHEHLKQLNLSKQELLRFYGLLDVLKEATREGKICPHYSKTHKHPKTNNVAIRAKSTESLQQRNSQSTKTNHLCLKKQPNENSKPRRSLSSTKVKENLLYASTASKSHANNFAPQRPSSSFVQRPKSGDQNYFGPKSFFNRPSIEHVKVRIDNFVKFFGVIEHSVRDKANQ